MHIAEGVLSAPVLVIGAVVAAGGIAWGLRKLPPDKIMTAALVGSVFFVASLVHVPVGFSSAHLIANGLVGILVGPAAFAVIFVALLLQSLLFQFGGITVLGVNTATMATGAVVAYGIFRLLTKNGASGPRLDIASFFSAVTAIAVAAFLTACALACSEEGFQVAAVALFVAHVPIMIAEGVITVLVVRILKKRAPQVLSDDLLGG